MIVELTSAFLLGLLGSVHCVGMCGPIALALSGGTASRGRFVAGRCVYNAGRVITYSVLGLVFGLFGHVLSMAGFQQALSIVAGLAMLIGAVIYLTGAPGWWHPTGTLGVWTKGMKQLWARLLPGRSIGALLGVGILNGLLPCGLVYAALAGAAASGNAVGGARFMAVFGLGTFPVMLTVSLAGHLVQAGLRRHLQPLVPAALGLMAALLILRGLGLGIPYLSPVLNPASGESCCHAAP
ncbi:MAG: sulfite exporter TauE/SafE family protein [Lentisphaerae bacterium]|nr:sulfite exporter TauE/SafE family protein [Lentisphaerota bacterium]